MSSGELDAYLARIGYTGADPDSRDAPGRSRPARPSHRVREPQPAAGLAGPARRALALPQTRGRGARRLLLRAQPPVQGRPNRFFGYRRN